MAEPLLMLDTNTASYIIKGKPGCVRSHLAKAPMSSICISVITEAELRHGVARKKGATQLAKAVEEFFLRVNILPWNSDVAKTYAHLRTHCESRGKPLGTMDMLIAAQAVEASATLVTNDKAFNHVSQYLALADWTKPLRGKK